MDPFTKSPKFEEIRLERYANLSWTKDELLLRNRPKHLREFFVGREVPFGLVAKMKFKRSMFGPFLDLFNSQQQQDQFLNDNKLSILNYDMKTYTERELRHFVKDNNFIDDIKELLEKAVDEREVINVEFLFDNIFALRITDTPLTFLDAELRKFTYLKILILCGNWLTDIEGCCLPRTLEYLELFANQIECLQNFYKKGPPRLVHVGLKRNWLIDGSQLHLLGKRKRFNYLRSLDLSENDICDLYFVVKALSKLESLFSLQLQGNPCWVLNTYKEDILKCLPRLVFLDNTEILPVDRDLDMFAVERKAALTFTCHRIIGLPAPKKEKGIIHAFHIELSAPLLEDIVLEPEPFPDDLSDDDNPKKKSGKKGKGESTKTSSSKKSKSGKGSKKGKKEPSPYEAKDEYLAERRARVTNTSFKTDRFSWAKIMQLPEEALVIESAAGNLTDIRDTFRSSVNVKLIYLKIKPPEKKKKGKAKGKGKGKGKGKDKGKGKGKAKGMEDTKTEDTFSKPVIEEEPREKILKKITLANFWCDLHSINWSDKTLDYYWANHKRIKSTAIEVEGNLRALNYTEGGGKKGKKEKDSKNGDNVTTGGGNEPLPKIFTCQVGFGINRSYFQN